MTPSLPGYTIMSATEFGALLPGKIRRRGPVHGPMLGKGCKGSWDIAWVTNIGVSENLRDLMIFINTPVMDVRLHLIPGGRAPKGDSGVVFNQTGVVWPNEI